MQSTRGTATTTRTSGTTGKAIAVAVAITVGPMITVLTAQPTSGTTYNATGGIALNGYDVVAYFTDGRAVRGAAAFSQVWRGTRWLFASASNRDAFIAAPEKYAPQFGGFCAYGVSRGYAVDIDPNAWSIVDGRLYLNYSKSVQRTWDKDRSGYIKRAETNWPAVAEKQRKQEER
jgi:hypothetical protein